MRKYLKEVSNLEEFAERLEVREFPLCIVVNGSEELDEFLEVGSELFNDDELLANVKKWKEWEVPIIIDDWSSRNIDIDRMETLYFPTQEDFIDYTRMKKNLAPLYHELDNPYITISKSEWFKILDR